MKKCIHLGKKGGRLSSVKYFIEEADKRKVDNKVQNICIKDGIW